MNIHVYLEDALGQQVNYLAKTTGKSRNSIIREAVKEWLVCHEEKVWPSSILNYAGISDFPEFEKTRAELLPPTEDPLK